MRFNVKTWTVWCVLFAGALAVNFAVQWRAEHAVDFTSEAARVSWALQHDRGFSDPYFPGPSGPTAQMPPIYPALHAAVCLIFGTGLGGWAAIIVFTTLAWSLQWTLAYDFLKLYGYPGAGMGAAMFGAIIPLPGKLFKWEAVFASCAVAAGACLMARLLARPDRAKAALFGLAAAISVLLTPSTALIYGGWGLLLLWRLPLTSSMRILAPAVACAIIPLGLWTARNYLTFHHFFFIRDDTGIAIGTSDVDCAQAVLIDNLRSGCFNSVSPAVSPVVLAQLREQGEYQFAKRMMRQTEDWIRLHPARFITLTVERAVYFWFPLERVDKKVLVNGILMSLATALSFFSAFWRRSSGFAIMAAGLVFYPLTYYLVQLEQRYRYPVFWMSVVLAAVGVEFLLGRLRRGSEPEKPTTMV